MKTPRLSAVWLAVVFLDTAAMAAVNGDLKAGSAGTMTFSLTSFAFNADPSSTPAGPPWSAEVVAGTNVTFAGGPLAVTEGIAVSTPLTGSALPVSSFLTFAAHANLVYSLTSVGPGSSSTSCASATAIGSSCSLFAGSPLVLTNAGNGTKISLPLSGTASDAGVGGLGTGSNYTGAFVASFVGMSPSQIQLLFCPSGTCTASDFTSGTTLTVGLSGDFLAVAPPTTPTITPTATPTPTVTPTSAPTSTPTVTPTTTPTTTPTATPTSTPAGIPTLGGAGMLIIGLVIAVAGLLLARRI